MLPFWNKNAFQYDAYSPQQWPSLRGGGVCSGGCLLEGVCWGGLLQGGVCLGNVCFRGVSALGDVCSWGVSALGVSAWGGVYSGCVCSGGLGGVSAPRGGLLLGGCVCVVSQHALRQTPPAPRGQTDPCKNITFATSLRTVKIQQHYIRRRAELFLLENNCGVLLEIHFVQPTRLNFNNSNNSTNFYSLLTYSLLKSIFSKS